MSEVTTRRTEPELEPLSEREFGSGGGVLTEPPGTQDRAGLGSKLWLLWGARRFLWKCAWVGLLVAVVISVVIRNRYTSTVRLMPPDSQSTSAMNLLSAVSGGIGSSAGMLASTLLGGQKTTGTVFVAILNSRTLQDRMVERFDLRKLYGERRWDGARKELERRTVIAEDRKSGVISIEVWDRDPKRSAALGAAYVEELDRLVATLSTSAARRERVFLEERLAAVKQDLDAAAREFSQFASKNATIDIQEQGKAMVGAAASLEGELIAAESELKGLEQIYTDNNVRVRALRARVAELRKQRDKIGGKDLESPKEEGDSLYPPIRKLPLLGVTYFDLFRRTKIQETVFEILTKQYEMAKVQEAKEIPTVRVLDAANVPEKKSFPPRLLIWVTGTLFSVTIGIVYVIAADKWNSRDPQDPSRVLAATVWGTAARSLRQATRKIRRWRGRKPVGDAEKPF